MKPIIYFLIFMYCSAARGQVIDITRFNESNMNMILFQKINEFTNEQHNYSLAKTTKGQKYIYKFIKRFNERMSLDEMNLRLNKVLGRRYASKKSKKVNHVVTVALMDTVLVQCGKTYQEIAEECVNDWVNSDNSFFLSWSRIANSVTYFNNHTQTLILALVYF